MKRRKRKAAPGQKTIIFLNGRAVGLHPDGKELWPSRLRERRRSNELIQPGQYLLQPKLNELHILTRQGQGEAPVHRRRERQVPPHARDHGQDKEQRAQLEPPGEDGHHRIPRRARGGELASSRSRRRDLTPEHTHLEVDPVQHVRRGRRRAAVPASTTRPRGSPWPAP